MSPVKRLLAAGGFVVAVAIGVLLVRRVDNDGQYRELLAEGERQLAAADTYGAIVSFGGAIKVRPDAMVAYLRRGEAYHAQRADNDAIRDLKEAISLAPDAAQPFIVLGDLYDSQGDAARAAEQYAEATRRLNDQDPNLLYKLALALYRAGSPNAAIAPLEKAVRLNDSIGAVHYLLGLVYRDTQQIAAAQGALLQAIRVEPALIAAREELADIYRTQGNRVQEMTHLVALADADHQVDRTVAIALAQARQAQFDTAIGTLRAALKRSPNDPAVQLALGRVYLSRAERTLDRAAIKQARDILETALGGTARRSEGLALYGRALYFSGDHAGAERILREAVATSPVAREAFGYLADASERLGHVLDARDALVSLDALEGDTVSADVRAARAVRLGALSLRANDPRGAATYLNQAVESGRKDAATLGLLAQARWQARDVAGALDAIDKALALEPSNADLLHLKRTIK